MTNQDKIEAVKIRIAKLRKHSQSAAELGSKEEAESFASKATELLLEYNLLESDINMNDEGDKFKNWSYSERISFKCNQSGQRSRLMLVQVLCDHNMCSTAYNSYSKTFTVYGNMSNVDVVVWMYNYLSVGLLRLAQESHVQLDPLTKARSNRYSYLKDFMIGAAIGINNKLKAQTLASVHATGIFSMIKVNDKDLIEFQKLSGKKLKEVKSKTIFVGQGYVDGLAAGENYSINKPLSVKETKLI